VTGGHHWHETVAAMSATISGWRCHELVNADNFRSHALISLATVANDIAPAIDTERGAGCGSVFALAKMNLGHVVLSL